MYENPYFFVTNVFGASTPTGILWYRNMSSVCPWLPNHLNRDSIFPPQTVGFRKFPVFVFVSDHRGIIDAQNNTNQVFYLSMVCGFLPL